MAASTGTVNKQYVSAITLMDVRDILPRAVDIHRDIDYADFVKLLGRYYPAKQAWFYTHVAESIIGVGDTTGQTVTGSGTPTVVATLTTATSGQFRVGDIIKFNNNKNGRVQSKTTAASKDTLTIKSVDNTNLTCVAGDKLVWFGTAGEEGGAPAEGIRHQTTGYYNHIQIFEDTCLETDIARMGETEVPGPNGTSFIGYLSHLRTLEKVKLGISAAAIGGQISDARFSDANPTLAGTGGYAVQTCMGLDQYTDTKGFKRALNALGTVTLADIEAMQDLMIAAKAPKDFMVIGATRAMRPYYSFLKNLGSGGLTSVRMNIDRRTVDLTVDNWTYAGFSYDFVSLKGFDNPNMFPATGGSIIGKSLYYVPKDSVPVVSGTDGNGATEPRFSMRYLDNKRKLGMSGPNVKWIDLIEEKWTGGLAPSPTNNTRVGQCTFTTYQAPHILGAEHFGREQIVS